MIILKYIILDNERIQVIKLCDIIYFNNYDNIKICIKTENNYNVNYNKYWKSSKFNQSINNLLNSIIYLI